jgi:tryptophan synthase alpha chain
MQIPFSEPMADGPVIVRANQEAIKNGTRVADCLAFAADMATTHDIPFLFMTYYNIIFKYGERAFFEKAKECGIKGLIVPDLPPEEGESFLALAAEYEIAPILIFAPTSTDARMRVLASLAQGFIYCVARRGVTGVKSVIGVEVADYLHRCRQASSLPLAVGFGIQDRDDVKALIGKADMAVIGSQTIRLVDEKGPQAVGPFIAGLR